ncbi:MAG: FCD domain-containing protein [Geminicoccaceae bacterium]
MGGSPQSMSMVGHNRNNSSIALAALRQWLAQDGRVPGDRLPPEREMAEQFEVGRRSLRRALDVLEAEGQVWRHQGKGTFIGVMPYPAEPPVAEIAAATGPADIMTARLAIEPELAALCCRSAEPADIVRMRYLAKRIDATRDPDAAELWDSALHRLIAWAAGNPLLLASFALVDEIRQQDEWRDLREQARNAESRALSGRQHREIIDAIAMRDADAARRAMRAHLSSLAERLDDIIGAPFVDTLR